MPDSDSHRWVAVLVGLLAAGCTRSCGEDKPFVPYQVGSSAPAVPSQSLSAPAPEAAAPTAAFPKLAKRLSPPRNTVTVAGHAFHAPKHSVFHCLLENDVDGDGKVDVFVWAAEQNGRSGRLVQLVSSSSGSHEPRIVYRSPDEPLEKDCRVTPTLSQVGPHTLSIDQNISCEQGDRRLVSVISPSRSHSQRLVLNISHPEGSVPIRLELRAKDVDGDGLDDLTASFSLDMKPFGKLLPTSNTVRLPVTYLDRPAGLSHDRREPAGTLRKQAQRVRYFASRSSLRRKAITYARRLRLLYAAVCGASSLIRVNGAPIDCQEKFFPDLMALYEAQAWLGERRYVEALGALTAAHSLGNDMSSSSKTFASRSKTVLKSWSKQVESTKVLAYYLPFRGSRFEDGRLQWGALKFDRKGLLHIVTDVGVLKIDPQRHTPVADQDAGEDRGWPLQLGENNTALGNAVVVAPPAPGWLRLAANDANHSTIWLPIPSPDIPRPTSVLPGATASSNPLITRVVGHKGSRFALIVRGATEWIDPASSSNAGPGLSTTTTGHPGGPWSPDGKSMAVASRFGVLVVSGKKAELWKAQFRAGSPSELTDCTVSNDRNAVACSNPKRRWTRILLRPGKQ